jgi:hypothetical protein
MERIQGSFFQILPFKDRAYSCKFSLTNLPHIPALSIFSNHRVSSKGIDEKLEANNSLWKISSIFKLSWSVSPI